MVPFEWRQSESRHLLTMAEPGRTPDPRWIQLQALASRGEVLQAEVLGRQLVRDHPDFVPALGLLAELAAQRNDLDTALAWIERAIHLAPEDPELRTALAEVQAANGQLPAARVTLDALLKERPSHLVAWLLLADACAASGDEMAALRARYQGVTRAHKAGRWLGPETTEPHLVDLVKHHVAHLRQARRDVLHAAIAPVRRRHGERSILRIERALAGYLGEADATPPDPRQRPKFLFIPDLPPGPYHDPWLQPWAATLRDAWREIRDEALGLLTEDRDFESFLGLKPGERAPEYVGGTNPAASWDAFFFYRHGRRFDDHHLRCPRTSALLESIDLCRIEHQAPEVCFSLIRPQSTIMPHYGVTNARLVFHLPLLVPPDCALNVIDGGSHHWREGEPMLFDDTFQHEAWNRSDKPRLILLMDCWNPHLTPAEREAVKHLVEAIDDIEQPSPRA